MYKIADVIENYYSINGITELNKDELLKLGIKENVYITINEDQTYFIVNKNKGIVYRSDWKRTTEEDGDY